MTETGKQTGRNGENDTLDIVVQRSDPVLDDVLTPAAVWLKQADTLPASAKMALRLILEELLTNTIMHGNAEAHSEIGLHLAVREDTVTIRFHDQGVAFNPATDLPNDSREDTLDDRPVGRLGWPLILHYCTLDNYERTNGQNRLELTFRPDV